MAAVSVAHGDAEGDRYAEVIRGEAVEISCPSEPRQPVPVK